MYLVGLASMPNLARNKEVDIMCDNAGFVGIYQKKHCSCPYTYTIAKALFDVAKGLGCRVRVKKTPRISGHGEMVADALSKGDWGRAWPLMPEKKEDPQYVPRSLLRWIYDPVPDMSLGLKVLEEMSHYTAVLLNKV